MQDSHAKTNPEPIRSNGSQPESPARGAAGEGTPGAPSARRAPRRQNIYAQARFDRLDRRRADAVWLDDRLKDPESAFVLLWQSRNLVNADEAVPRAVFAQGRIAAEALEAASHVALLGEAGGRTYLGLDLSALSEEGAATLAGEVAEGARFEDLRRVGAFLPAVEAGLLAYARGLFHWHSRTRFCGVCGAPTTSVQSGHVRVCTASACQAPQFPRTDPAVIMLVHDGADHCVMGRNARQPAGMHSTLAGFVEPGESLEQAVAREVEEEVGLVIDPGEVRYSSSQPWPFPASLMLGFHARCDRQPLTVNLDEMETARWFHREEVEAAEHSAEGLDFTLPRGDSIARRLIREWLAGEHER